MIQVKTYSYSYKGKSRPRGLGDTMAEITHITGISRVVKEIEKLTGIPCGCEKRLEFFNKLFPYKG